MFLSLLQFDSPSGLQFEKKKHLPLHITQTIIKVSLFYLDLWCRKKANINIFSDMHTRY